MTALEQFERLESIGLWKESAEAQRREVIVSFGDATLVLSDSNENPLTHWSLAAVEKVSKSGKAIIYSPDNGETETLEISDDTMVKAIETIQARLRRGLPKPGRGRWIMGAIVVAAVLLLAQFWFPSAIARYATALVPDAKARQIGADALRHVAELSGTPCSSPLGNIGLQLLEDRLIGTPANQVVVLDMGRRDSAHLPGGIILLNRRVIEEAAEPEVAAGHILYQRAIEDEYPPLLDLFNSMSSAKVVAFLTSGNISEKDLRRFAQSQVTGAEKQPSVENLGGLFELTGVGARPFAHSLKAEDPLRAALLNPSVPQHTNAPLMRDGEWLALQEICQ